MAKSLQYKGIASVRVKKRLEAIDRGIDKDLRAIGVHEQKRTSLTERRRQMLRRSKDGRLLRMPDKEVK